MTGRCGRCGGEAKPLFTSWYCVAGCDRGTSPAPGAPPMERFIARHDGWEAFWFPKGSDLGDISWASHGWWGGLSYCGSRFDSFVRGKEDEPGWQMNRNDEEFLKEKIGTYSGLMLCRRTR